MVQDCRCNISSVGPACIDFASHVCKEGSMVICTYGSWTHHVLGVAWIMSGPCMHQEASDHAGPAC